jgi:hypothetical protein
MSGWKLKKKRGWGVEECKFSSSKEKEKHQIT